MDTIISWYEVEDMKGQCESCKQYGTVRYVTEPFQLEINGINMIIPMCENCYMISIADI